MPRPIPPEQQLEFDDLVALNLAIAQAQDDLDPVSFYQTMKMSRVDYFRRAVATSRPTRTHIKGWREALNDTLESGADNWSRVEFAAVDAALRERCGVTLDSLLGRRLARVAAVRERGRIATDEQFHLLYGRVEQIWQQPEHDAEFQALSALLADYEQRKARRRPKV